MATPTSGMMGFDPDKRTTTEDFKLGTTFVGDDSHVWTFVQANGAIVANQTDVAMTTAFQASDGTGALANTAAFADNEYGWIRTNIPLANGSDA